MKFFSLNALSSPIVIRIYMDVMLTMVADICYRLFARDINKFEDATPQTIFSKFIDVTGNVVVSLRCLDELDLSVGTGILFQATDQEIELAPYMTVVQ